MRHHGPRDDEPCDSYSGNLCTGFGNDDTTCFKCGWDRFQHDSKMRELFKRLEEEQAARPPTLLQIVQALSQVYDDEGAAIWLTSNQVWPHPGGGTYHASPLFIFKEGRPKEVMAAIERLESGAV